MNEYPTEEELNIIEKWDLAKKSVRGLLDDVKSIWWCSDMGFQLTGKRVLRLELHTLGWSGNEDIIGALRKNYIFWGMYWKKSIRGGHFYFRIEALK